MTDLQDLKAVMDSAPAPDAARKARNIAKAREIFATRQESPAEPRPKGQDNPNGGRTWLMYLKSNWTMGAMSLGGALAAGFAVFVVASDARIWSRQTTPVPFETSPHDVARPAQKAERDQSAGLPSVDPVPVAPDAAITSTPGETALPPNALMELEDSFSGLLANREARSLTLLQEPSEELLRRASPPPSASGRLDVDGWGSVGGAEDGDLFASARRSDFKRAGQEPLSTFSVDVDTASWGIARRWITEGRLPPREAVRIEEFINAFDYDLPAPKPGEGPPFSIHSELVANPWSEGAQLFRLAIQGARVDVADRPPLDLTFLIDVSGSMNSADKLPLLVASLNLLLGELRADDRVGIVTYASQAGVALPLTSVRDRGIIEDALGRLRSGGTTAGGAGIETAYEMASGGSETGRLSRVILATDGDFNVGLSSLEELKSLVERKRESGVFLSVLGFGRGNLNDAIMQTLAQNGNGTADYIGSLTDARRVLVDKVQATTLTIAKDVKIQVEFNPEVVRAYRLLGYETRALAQQDFDNDKVDAGDIGAGHSVTALYEIIPVGSELADTKALRYATTPARTLEATDQGADRRYQEELAYVKLRYKEPTARTSRLIDVVVSSEEVTASPDTLFAAAIAGFGLALREDDRLGHWGLTEAAELAENALSDDPAADRRDAVMVMQRAVSLVR